MNGHDADGIAAYGPGDEIELMAAILAAHDEEAVDPAWWAMMDDPICPVCGWTLIPVEDGRMICPDCGYEQGDSDSDDDTPVTQVDPDALTCLECQDPPELNEIAYGQLVCPDCGADWFCRGYYDECRAEMHWDASAQRWALNELEQ